MSESILICGANWLGDAIMSMPAVSLLKKRAPTAGLVMLAKPGVAPLWKMSRDVGETVELAGGATGVLRAVGSVRGLAPAKAYVFPNSFRSALIPFLAGVPERIGGRGHQRAWMLTRVADAPADPKRAHQSWEHANLVCDIASVTAIEPPRIDAGSDARKRILERFRPALERRPAVIGLMPGAARGPSKRWPAENFIEAGRRLVSGANRGVVVLGTAAESDLCAEVAAGIGDAATSLAGQTSLCELAAILGLCRVVICNDSGGMHLAAACGTRVVAIFGLTDPAKTGPMGEGHRVILAEGARRSRDIATDSSDAEEALRSIGWETVTEAAEESLASSKSRF